MITQEQKQAVLGWIETCKPGFENAFTDMALLSGAFGMTGNDCDFSAEVRNYLFELADAGSINTSGGWCGTVFWRW